MFLAEKADLKGKASGAFGAFGWSGEAPIHIYDTILHIFKMDMVGHSLPIKSGASGRVQMAKDFGKEISSKLTES